MIAYEKVGEITEGTRKALLMVVNGSTLPQWEICNGPDRNYLCWTVSPTLMFVLIPPGGMVDHHKDAPAKANRINIILQTNERCVNYSYSESVTFAEHLAVRGIYRFDASLEHWATNAGDTDRIVLVETLP